MRPECGELCGKLLDIFVLLRLRELPTFLRSDYQTLTPQINLRSIVVFREVSNFTSQNPTNEPKSDKIRLILFYKLLSDLSIYRVANAEKTPKFFLCKP